MQIEDVMEPRTDFTHHTNVHDFLSKTTYKNVIAFSLITGFFLLFHIIYLSLESFGVSKSVRLTHAARICAKQERIKNKKKKKSDDAATPMSQTDLRQERLTNMELALWSNRNLEVSFIHSVICSAWLIHICVYNGPIFDDLFSYVSWDSYLLVAFSCGYFLYDLYDMAANGQLKEQCIVCLHHFIVLLCFIYNMIYLCNIGYTTLALLMEFNSVFLHARKLLNFYNVDKRSLVVLGNTVLNLLTFTVFRFGVLYMITHGIIYDGHRVTTAYLTTLAVCTIAMAGINVVLYYRLLKKDCFAAKKQHHAHHDDSELIEQILNDERFANSLPLKTDVSSNDEKIFISEMDAKCNGAYKRRLSTQEFVTIKA